jgi:hypothetical protein
MMAAIHPIERPVMHRLHTILDCQRGLVSKLAEQIEHIVRHAVRSRANGQSNDLGVRERLLVHISQTFHWRVCIRGGLEVSHEVVAVVALSQAVNPTVNLLADGPPAPPAAGAETLVVTEDTTADRNRPIDIGAGETGIHTDASNAMPELVAEEESVRKVS